MGNFVKQYIPRKLKKKLKYLWKYTISMGKGTENVFTEIYEQNLWGKAPNGGKFFSGGGTFEPDIIEYQSVLKNIITEFEINSIFEIGCGDFTIMNTVLSGTKITYTGSDVVKNLIDHLTVTYGDEKTNFLHMDATKSKFLPDAELCIIRQVLQHLNNKQISEILKKTIKYKYVIITEHIPLFPECINGDKITGKEIRLENEKISGVFLEAPPFSQKCRTILSYRSDFSKIPAIMLTCLIENKAN